MSAHCSVCDLIVTNPATREKGCSMHSDKRNPGEWCRETLIWDDEEE